VVQKPHNGFFHTYVGCTKIAPKWWGFTPNPCSLPYASTIPPNYDHDHDPYTSTSNQTAMPRRRLLELPLPPPPPPYNHLRQIPHRPPSSIAPPTQIEGLFTTQEPPLPESLYPDDFFLPAPNDSDFETDSSTDSNSNFLTTNSSLPSLQYYDDLDDLDDLNFSDLEEDTI